MLDGQVLGKPADRADALRMLACLSGTTHEVHTAVVLAHGQTLHQAVSITEVSMRPLSRAECERYCDSGEPFGKAGSYGIQGLAGSFIRHISGSYSGVMGLPLFETSELLGHAGIALP
ncbi:maf-like family protein [Bordetella holmesii 41130]|nr:maf-like family protein [Bordetella holmesii ATCC 51541]EWM48480.1 maf-like family protein [Bordetella holmesii 41130]EWM49421.1 maf-like family protein [Bordetella holmesii 35009]EXX94604.1 maf-like family protein [Bordetella holmesii 1058]